MKRALSLAAVGLAGLMGACAGQEEGAVSSPTGALRAGEIGRVGAVGWPPAGLELVAEEPRAAWEAIRSDLLLGQLGREGAPHAVAVLERSTWARALLEKLTAEALAEGPLRAEELEREKEQLWLEVDRPRAVRAIDVFLPVDELAPDREAYSLAERIHEAVQGKTSVNEFAAAVRSVPAGDQPVELFLLPPLAADGRVVPLEAQDQQSVIPEAEVIRAVTSLEEVGQTSEILGVRGGFHIFLVTEIHPPVRLPPAELEERLTRRAAATRAAPRLEGLRRELRAKTEVRVVPRHATLTRLVWQKR